MERVAAGDVDHRLRHDFDGARFGFHEPGHGCDRRVQIVERDHREHAIRRQFVERDFDGFEQRERSLRAREELRRVIEVLELVAAAAARERRERGTRGAVVARSLDRRQARRRCRREPTGRVDARPASVGEDHVERVHVVDRRAVHDRVRPARVRRRHAADGALAARRRIGAVVQAPSRPAR